MLPGMNPRKMQQMMRQLGITQVDIPAVEVIIRTEDKDIVIKDPAVAKVNMMGQETFQIVGEVHERERQSSMDITPDDIKTVMEQTGASEAQAKTALKNAHGNLAEAILSIQEKDG